MVNLEASTQKSGAMQVRWQNELPDKAVSLGRSAEQSDWAASWDDQISRKHAVLTWDEKNAKLRVQICTQARNPVWFQGQKFKAGEEFSVQAFERFIIGETLFRVVPALEPEPPSGFMERTCAPAELRQLSYVDAGMRIEILSALPELIRQTTSDEEFEEQIVQVVLQGMPRAYSASLIWINPETATRTTDPVVKRTASRRGDVDSQISRRLIFSAVCTNRQTCFHRWGADLSGDSSLNNPSVGVAQWGICAPLTGDTTPGLAIYLGGVETEFPPPGGPTLEQLQDGDIKFVGTVAELVSALWALRTLQKTHAVLGSLISPRVREQLARQDIAELLAPRVTEVTVVCCDLRGSCRIAEEGEADLETTCERVLTALEEMTTRISEHDGIISDFQGDAAMCFWGWPRPLENDVEHAARAALAISRGFALLGARKGHPLAGFACGLGLASGPGVAGRLGTMDQFKIGVFGPTINLAARLESLTKVFRVPVVADDESIKRLKGKVRHRRLARLQPYGMSKQLMIHEIMPPAAGDVKSLSENQRLNYEAALDKFIDGDWPQAEKLFAKLVGDGPSEYLRGYIRDKDMKPPADWAGVIVLAAK